MNEVLTQKLTQQNRELTESFHSYIASVRIDLAEDKKERLAGKKELELRMKELEHRQQVHYESRGPPTSSPGNQKSRI